MSNKNMFPEGYEWVEGFLINDVIENASLILCEEFDEIQGDYAIYGSEDVLITYDDVGNGVNAYIYIKVIEPEKEKNKLQEK